MHSFNLPSRKLRRQLYEMMTPWNSPASIKETPSFNPNSRTNPTEYSRHPTASLLSIPPLSFPCHQPTRHRIRWHRFIPARTRGGRTMRNKSRSRRGSTASMSQSLQAWILGKEHCMTKGYYWAREAEDIVGFWGRRGGRWTGLTGARFVGDCWGRVALLREWLG